MPSDFDLFESDEQEDIDDGFGSIGSTQDSGDVDFGDFGGQNKAQKVDEISSGKSTVIKQAIIIVIIAVMVITLAFVVIQWLTGGNSKNKNEIASNNNNTVVSENVTPPSNNEAYNNWKRFEHSDELAFNANYIASTFTVTGIDHYLNIVDSEKNLMVKTVLTGSLSGFIGTYELEIPYSKGNQLSVGNYFSVEVQIGNSNGKKVVGEIKY